MFALRETWVSLSVFRDNKDYKDTKTPRLFPEQSDLGTKFWKTPKTPQSHFKATSKPLQRHPKTPQRHFKDSQRHLDCPRAGPGRPSANFAGPGPGSWGPVRPQMALALPRGRPGPTLALIIYIFISNIWWIFKNLEYFLNIFINFDPIQVKIDVLCSN